MSRGYLGLGSNVGDRLHNIRLAVERLDRHPRIAVTRVSAVYETEAVDGAVGQRDFYNAVVEVDTDFEPRALLAACKEVERELGRDPSGRRHAPRTIDLDILLLGEQHVHEDGLVIPHPDLARRRFALVPLLELAPQLPYREALQALGKDQRVTVIDPLQE